MFDGIVVVEFQNILEVDVLEQVRSDGGKDECI